MVQGRPARGQVHRFGSWNPPPFAPSTQACSRNATRCKGGRTAPTAHLDLGVASVQQADGQADALLEDLLILGAGDEVADQLGGPLLVQPALGGCDG